MKQEYCWFYTSRVLYGLCFMCTELNLSIRDIMKEHDTPKPVERGRIVLVVTE